MKLLTVLIFSAAIFLITSPNESESFEPESVRASVRFKNGKLRGYLKLIKRTPEEPVELRGYIVGLRKGFYTLDIHQNGDTSFRCKNIGQHFGRTALATIRSNHRRRSFIRYSNDEICLTGTFSIVGRSIAIHYGSVLNNAHTATPVVGCGIVQNV